MSGDEARIADLLRREYLAHRLHHAEARTVDSPEGFAASFAERATPALVAAGVGDVAAAKAEALREALTEIDTRVRAAQDEFHGADFGTILTATVNAYSDACRDLMSGASDA